MFDAATEKIIPSSRVVRVHLFRHGEVVTGASRICRGHSDVPLSDIGIRQSKAVAERFLTGFGTPDRVFTSDLARCAQFAAEFSAGAEPTPALREQHMGSWEGKTWESLTRDDPAGVTAFWDDYTEARPGGGETWGEAALRAEKWWTGLGPLSGRIVVVTHIGPIRALLCHWLGIPYTSALRFAPGYATETRVLHADAGVVVELMGGPPPL